MTDRDTPVNPELFVAIESEIGNGHDHRRDPPHPRPESREEAVDRAILECAERFGFLIGKQSQNEQQFAFIDANFDLVIGEQKRLAKDVDGIAKAIGANRTFSGQVALNLPAEIRGPMQTGEHVALGKDAVASLRLQFEDLQARLESSETEKADEKARREGFEAALSKVEADNAEAEKKKKDRRERIVGHFQIAGITVAIAVPALTAIGWLFTHFH